MMSSSDKDNQVAAKSDAVRYAWTRIRVDLENRRDRINHEIGLYPTPIAGCDQQFNYLLEQRAGISAECRQLKEAEKESLSGENPLKVLDDFIRSSHHIEKGAGRAIRRFMAEALSSPQD